MPYPGTIEEALGLPPNDDLAAIDLYARQLERWAWTEMIPQPSEVIAHYYFDLKTSNATETGAGTEANPYLDLRSINTVLAAHDPTDVIELHVRTTPSGSKYLCCDTTHKIVLDETTPEIRWVPWQGQARFSAGLTKHGSGWTLVSGTMYKRTRVKPGWVSWDNGEYLYPDQWKYVDSTAECAAELYTWHHDGTDLFVNSGGNPNLSNQRLRLSEPVKESLIRVAGGCRRVLLSGIHTEGFGMVHGEGGEDADASGIKINFARRGDRVLVANCKDYCGASHPMSCTAGGSFSADENDWSPTVVFIDCESGGGYELNKGVIPFNMYGGNRLEAALIRCRVIAGPANQSQDVPPTRGHSQPGSTLGLYFVYDFECVESKSLIRPTTFFGTPAITENGLPDDDPFHRSVIARYTVRTQNSSGNTNALAPVGKNSYNGYRVDITYNGANTNFGRSGAGNFQIGDGKVMNGVFRYENRNFGSVLRLWGDGSGIGDNAISQTWINCAWLLSSGKTAGTYAIGSTNTDLSDCTFINCIFASMDGTVFSWPTTAFPLLNCGFYKITPPAYATDPIILDSVEEFIASYESQLLGAGASVAAYANMPYDFHGRKVSLAAPPLGPFQSITQQ